jgi:glycosyltransferase involved in cell wall biosynthesis/tetratricopeptide (TPR) repeat protein
MVKPAHAVTVGMPVYNDPEGLLRSVPTVFGQSWDGPVRLLLVDDGSDRETLDVIDALAAAYDGIDVVRNPENRGRPFVRNQILEHAGDGHLAWLDAGDLWHPRKLEVQLAALDADDHDPGTPVICVSPLRRYFVDRGVARTMVPDVEGDQLRNALTGRLFGYLPTMLGRVEAFRDLGFDERLLRRQDYDFLVRFVANGGRVISTPADLPLFTYLKSDSGASAATVAEVNEVIRRKHAPYYAPYGKALARQVKGNQHRLVSRFYDANDRRLQAARYRWLARLADPSTLRRDLRPARRGSGGRERRKGIASLRDVVRAMARRVRGIVPLLRRLGLLSLARRFGLVRLAGRLGLMRIFYRELRGEQGRPLPRYEELQGAAAHSTGSAEAASAEAASAEAGAADEEVARAAGGDERAEAALGRIRKVIRSGEHARAIDYLEEFTATTAVTPVEVWLLLEEAHRRASRLHSAQETLERGLEQHPGHRQLRVRLSELQGLRRDWEGCVQTWSSLAEATDEDLTSISYLRAARSLRMLEQPRRAFEVAQAGHRRWPDDERFDEELGHNRALTVDWEQAVSTSGAADPQEAGGAITDLGFLAGRSGPVEGHVDLTGQHAPKVAFLLNGREVASSYASADPDAGERLGRFSINVHDLLDYVGDGDILAVQSDGRAVLTPDGSRHFVVEPGHASRADELFRKLDAGYVFMKFGRLSLGNTTERKRAILEAYDEVAALLDEQFGYTLFPLYGNLLGAVRDHDFIEHDVGGFDVGYVSQHQSPEGVRRELSDICRMLAAHDYYLELKPWSVYVRRTRGEAVFVDLNFAWFNPEGELNLSYGWRYAPVTDAPRLHMRRECPIFGHLVPIPGNAEAVLEQLYGPDWPIPIQGFDPDAGITRDTRYLLSQADSEKLEAHNPDRIRVRAVLTPQGEIVDVG